MIKKRVLWLLFLVLMFLDQATKYWARHSLSKGHSISLIKGVLSFSYVENRGAAWGIFQGKYIALGILTVIIAIGLVWFIYRIPQNKRFNWLQFTMILLLSGAIGNLFDRFYFQFVTDFIYFELIDFPVFNVADCYVTISAFFLIWLFCFYYKDDELKFIPFIGD